MEAGGRALELEVASMTARITVKIVNGGGRVLKKKTIRIRGRLRIWLFAAHKTLTVISSAVEELGEHAKKAEIEMEGVERNEAFELFKTWVSKYSPIPAEIFLVEKRPA